MTEHLTSHQLCDLETAPRFRLLGSQCAPILVVRELSRACGLGHTRRRLAARASRREIAFHRRLVLDIRRPTHSTQSAGADLVRGELAELCRRGRRSSRGVCRRSGVDTSYSTQVQSTSTPTCLTAAILRTPGCELPARARVRGAMARSSVEALQPRSTSDGLRFGAIDCLHGIAAQPAYRLFGIAESRSALARESAPCVFWVAPVSRRTMSARSTLPRRATELRRRT